MSKRLLLSGLLFSALVQASSSPEHYAYQAELTESEAALQRVEIPIDVLLAVTRADLGDIRVFDSAGKSLPSSIRKAPPQQLEKQVELPFHVFSSYSKRSSKIVTTREQTSQKDQISEIRTTETIPVDQTRPVYIIELGDDDSGITIESVELQWTHQPDDQFLRLRVEVGNNLDNWRTIQKRKILTNANTDKPEWRTIDSIPKSKKYLRLTPLISVDSFEIQKVVGSYHQSIAETKIWHRLEALRQPEDHQDFYAFDMPAVIKADQLRFIPATEQTLIGGELYASKDDFEHKFRVRRRLQQHNFTDGEIKPSPVIKLPGQKYQHWWFKPDRVLDSPPHAEIAFPVYEMLFLGNDAGPFRLAWGNFEASAPNNDLTGILSDQQKQTQAELVQLRTVDIMGGEARLTPPVKLPWLKWLLWLLMFAAVAATGKMALSLLRDMKSS